MIKNNTRMLIHEILLGVLIISLSLWVYMRPSPPEFVTIDMHKLIKTEATRISTLQMDDKERVKKMQQFIVSIKQSLAKLPKETVVLNGDAVIKHGVIANHTELLQQHLNSHVKE